MTTQVQNKVDQVTLADLKKYNTNMTGCTCADSLYRDGGSYTDAQGNKACKHQLALGQALNQALGVK